MLELDLKQGERTVPWVLLVAWIALYATVEGVGVEVTESKCFIVLFEFFFTVIVYIGNGRYIEYSVCVKHFDCLLLYSQGNGL